MITHYSERVGKRRSLLPGACSIRRAMINDDAFPVVVCLSVHRGNRLPQVGFAVERGDDDGDQWVTIAHIRCAPSYVAARSPASLDAPCTQRNRSTRDWHVTP